MNVAQRGTLGSRGGYVRGSPGGTIEGSVVPPGLDMLIASPNPSTTCWATISRSLRDYEHAKHIRKAGCLTLERSGTVGDGPTLANALMFESVRQPGRLGHPSYDQ
jgi:hypothetical protein